MWPLTTVKLPVVTLLASARANVTNGSRLLGYTLLSPSRNYFILKKEPESWHLALSAKKEVNVTVTAWQGGVTSDRLTSVQLANVTWLPPPPLHERSAVNLLLFILRESGSLLGNLCLHVVRQRFDVCPAALVFQDAFYRPGSCHSHTLTDWLSRRLPQLFLFNLIFSDTVISATQLPKTSSMFNMLPPA